MSTATTLTLPVEDLFARAYEWQEQGLYYRAGQTYAEYLTHRGNDPSGWNNLGNCYRALGCDEKAVPCFDRALELKPGRISSRLNRGLTNLSLGEYVRAWPDYEARLGTIKFRREIVAQRDRQWRGETLAPGESLYLFGNQGLGDALQVWRYLENVAGRVGHVILELQEPLVSLTRALPDNVTVIRRGDPVSEFAKWAELFSLPGLFGTTIDSIPAPRGIGYERDAAVAGKIRSVRRASPDALHIGLVWSGTPANSVNVDRALALEHFLPILEQDRFRFHSLQKGPPSAELGRVPSAVRPVDLAPFLKDFAATATAVELLDLVITVDTSIPNLIGAMGHPAWVLLHRPADWRWGREGETTPWYPDLTLIRQSRLRSWEGVIPELSRRLDTFRPA